MTTSPDKIRIQGPCTKNWNDLEGDERSRFCSDCRLPVHNLEAMTRAEAQALVTKPKSRVCVRLVPNASGAPTFLDTPADSNRGPSKNGVLERGSLMLRLVATAAASLVAACRPAPTPAEISTEPPPATTAPDVEIPYEVLSGMGYVCGPDEE